MLGASLEEALPQDSGDVRKHVAMAALSVWLLGPDGTPLGAGGGGGAGVGVVDTADGTQTAPPAPVHAVPLLPPCDGVFVVGTAAQAAPGGMLRADCSLTLPSLHLSVADGTLASAARLADRVDLVSRLNAAAAFCPRAWRMERRLEPRCVVMRACV